MGLFDFIKDVGLKLSHDDKLEASLRETVEKAHLSIQDFRLEQKKDVIYLSGVAATPKDAELARLIVGNHKGVEKVNDDGLSIASQAAPTPAPLPSQPSAAAGTVTAIPYAPAEMVTVKSGDTLSKIAKQYLGESGRYQEIFEANRPMLKDPDEIFPGQILRIPKDLIARSHGSSTQPHVS